MADQNRMVESAQSLIESISKTMNGIEWDFFIRLADEIEASNRIFVFGAGRSGLVARSFGMRLMHAGLPVFIPGETITPAAAEGDLVVVISCTGTTGVANYIAERAKSLGARVIVLTANKDAAIIRNADKSLVIPVSEENIVLRAAVFEHTASLCLDALFNVLSWRRKIDENEYKKRHANLE
jgi:6-phospho-3-hexuloisomerase